MYMQQGDSPGVPLPIGFKKMNAKFDNFELYLMFKPSGVLSLGSLGSTLVGVIVGVVGVNSVLLTGSP
jgi:hypothetical protein